MKDPLNYFHDDEIPFEEKNQFWENIYDKIAKAIQNRYSFIVIFQLEELGIFMDDSFTVIIKKEDYMRFLKNFLMWSEELERYEICIEVKKLIRELEQWEEN